MDFIHFVPTFAPVSSMAVAGVSLAFQYPRFRSKFTFPYFEELLNTLVAVPAYISSLLQALPTEQDVSGGTI